MKANDVVAGDLRRMCSDLEDDLGQMAGKRLLMTGGAGFLGYYMVQVPLAWNRSHPEMQPISVTVHDNFHRGAPAWLDRLRLDQQIALIQHDVRNPLPADFPDFDYIIHAAGIASPRYYRSHPIETMDANINGLRNLLDQAVRQSDRRPVSGLLFFSSSEIYGDPTPDAIPTPENYRGLVSCTGPRACYDESKRYGETLSVNFAQVHGLPITVARPFNNYGPGMKITDGRVIADFARDILNGNDIVMHSDGQATRTFCYVSDAVTGYYLILTRGRSGEAYNIGSDSPELSMVALAERMKVAAAPLTGYDGNVISRPSPEAAFLIDNPNRRCPVIEKARNELGYQPKIDIDEGLSYTLAWYLDNRGGEER